MSELWRCEFEVLGDPVGKPAARAGIIKRGDKVFAMLHAADDDHPIHRWAGCIRSAALPYRLETPFADGALEVKLSFLMPPPQAMVRHGRLLRTWPITRPDTDNLCKAVLDALTGLLWADDNVVVRLALEKRYAQPGQLPRCQVRIEELEDPLAPRSVGQMAMEVGA